MATEVLDKLPLWYTLFFLYIEPFSTLVGAYFGCIQQQTYLELTHARSFQNGISTGVAIVLFQLGNLYLMFALSEALVLRSSREVKVWRAVLIPMLIADLGHLYSVSPLGLDAYWSVLQWNSIDWGNIGFVYVGACTRTAFLLGFGLRNSAKSGSVKIA